MADVTVAKTILQQLGGNRFVIMTGANAFTGMKSGLCFFIPRAKNGINHIRIDLTGDDLYNMTFSKVSKGPKVIEIAKERGLYNDMLESTFTEHTGLYTSLGRMN